MKQLWPLFIAPTTKRSNISYSVNTSDLSRSRLSTQLDMGLSKHTNKQIYKYIFKNGAMSSPWRQSRKLNSSSIDIAQSSSSKVFKTQMDMVWSHSWPCFEKEVELETSCGPFQPELSCDSVIAWSGMETVAISLFS